MAERRGDSVNSQPDQQDKNNRCDDDVDTDECDGVLRSSQVHRLSLFGLPDVIWHDHLAPLLTTLDARRLPAICYEGRHIIRRLFRKTLAAPPLYIPRLFVEIVSPDEFCIVICKKDSCYLRSADLKNNQLLAVDNALQDSRFAALRSLIEFMKTWNLRVTRQSLRDGAVFPVPNMSSGLRTPLPTDVRDALVEAIRRISSIFCVSSFNIRVLPHKGKPDPLFTWIHLQAAIVSSVRLVASLCEKVVLKVSFIYPTAFNDLIDVMLTRNVRILLFHSYGYHRNSQGFLSMLYEQSKQLRDFFERRRQELGAECVYREPTCVRFFVTDEEPKRGRNDLVKFFTIGPSADAERNRIDIDVQEYE